jgi:hypothetical protein
MVSPDSRVNLARRQAETPLSDLFRFPGPALHTVTRGLDPIGAKIDEATQDWNHEGDRAVILESG